MAKKNKKTEAVEPEEKTLEDELSALEDVAASLEGADEKAATITGHPYDLVVVDDDDQEDDAEGLLKPPGGVEQAKEMGPKKRVVVVEMDPEQITDDMKAYVVEVPDEEDEYPKAHVPDHEEEGPELRRRPISPMQAVPPAPMRAVPTEDVPNASPMTPVGAGAVGPPFVPEEDDDDALKGWGKPDKGRLARLMALANGEDPDAEEEEDEKNMVPSLPMAVLIGKEDAAANIDPMEKRLDRMGVKSLGNFDFLCAIERTIRSGDVCNFCRGGCASEKGLPGLLEVEVSAETEFGGEVVDSGYAPKDDMFVLDLKTEDGFKEVYYAGNGTRLGWIALDEGLSVKSLEDGASDPLIVSFEEAEMMALRHVDGKSYGVDVDLFHGEDAYVVEIDGVDGKSYDVYVSIDGKVLGTDMIELTDGEQEDLTELRLEKEALEAELAIKTNYEGEALQDLIKEGAALKNGSFPIVDAEDLQLAVKAAYKHPEAQSHIERRAEELERTDIIPSEWAESKQAETDEFMASLMELQMLEVDSDEPTTE
tara:strand:- start:3304 stop:4914 length:1611 start_codon:yes stop_codon:yes gene_type:complete